MRPLVSFNLSPFVAARGGEVKLTPPARSGTLDASVVLGGRLHRSGRTSIPSDNRRWGATVRFDYREHMITDDASFVVGPVYVF